MYKGVTPTYNLQFCGVDFNEADNILVTISDSAENVILELTPEHTETALQFSLTQEQTLAMPSTPCLLQANWTFNNGENRACSNIVRINFRNNLKNEVMQ